VAPIDGCRRRSGLGGPGARTDRSGDKYLTGASPALAQQRGSSQPASFGETGDGKTRRPDPGRGRERRSPGYARNGGRRRLVRRQRAPGSHTPTPPGARVSSCSIATTSRPWSSRRKGAPGASMATAHSCAWSRKPIESALLTCSTLTSPFRRRSSSLFRTRSRVCTARC
jgi:hypothetical protein